MIKSIAVLLILSTGLILAQLNSLANVSAKDIMLERTGFPTDEMKKEIDDKGIDYWFLSTDDIAYSTDCSFIAQERKEKTSGKSVGLWIVDTKANTEKQITPNIVSSMEWSVDNEYLAYVQCEFIPDPKITGSSRKPIFNSERLCVYNHQSGETSSIATMKGFAIKHKWAPTGNRLAYSYVDHELKRYRLMVYDVEANRTYQIDEILLCDLWNFDWSPNGRMIVYTNPLEIDRLVNEEAPLKSDIFIANYDGSDRIQLTVTPEAELFVKWLPDGMKIVTEVLVDPASGYAPTHKIISLQRKEGK